MGLLPSARVASKDSEKIKGSIKFKNEYHQEQETQQTKDPLNIKLF